LQSALPIQESVWDIVKMLSDNKEKEEEELNKKNNKKNKENNIT